MRETVENQSINTKMPGRVGDTASRTPHAPDAVPVFLTKKWLAMTMDCYMQRCGKVNYSRLHRLVFTDAVLSEIGMSRAELKMVRDFDLVTSNKLKQILSL